MEESPGSRVIADIAVIGKARPRHGGAETRRKTKIGHRQECLCHVVADIAVIGKAKPHHG